MSEEILESGRFGPRKCEVPHCTETIALWSRVNNCPKHHIEAQRQALQECNGEREFLRERAERIEKERDALKAQLAEANAKGAALVTAIYDRESCGGHTCVEDACSACIAEMNLEAILKDLPQATKDHMAKHKAMEITVEVVNRYLPEAEKVIGRTLRSEEYLAVLDELLDAIIKVEDIRNRNAI